MPYALLFAFSLCLTILSFVLGVGHWVTTGFNPPVFFAGMVVAVGVVAMYSTYRIISGKV